jgi:hypothetical protein
LTQQCQSTGRRRRRGAAECAQKTPRVFFFRSSFFTDSCARQRPVVRPCWWAWAGRGVVTQHMEDGSITSKHHEATFGASELRAPRDERRTAAPGARGPSRASTTWYESGDLAAGDLFPLSPAGKLLTGNIGSLCEQQPLKALRAPGGPIPRYKMLYYSHKNGLGPVESTQHCLCHTVPMHFYILPATCWKARCSMLSCSRCPTAISTIEKLILLCGLWVTMATTHIERRPREHTSVHCAAATTAGAQSF